MTIYTWLSLLAICCLGAVSPGPSLGVVLKQTLHNGRSHALVASWFHALGVGLWAFATVFGLAIVVTESAAIFNLITWCGAGYLIWMGIQSLRAAKGVSRFEIGVASNHSYWQAATEGAMISLLNPKLAIFFIALFSQFVSAEATRSDQLIMIATATLVDGFWYTLVAFIFATGPVLKWLQQKNDWVNRISGVIFIGLALRVLTLS